MADYDAEKIKKIIGMLQSDHDGEAASAARMLALHAKKQGHSITEMLTAVFGGGGMLQHRLDAALHMVEVAKEAVAAALAEAEHERARRIALERVTSDPRPRPQQQEDRSAFWNAAAQAQPKPTPWGDPFRPGSGGWNPPPPPPRDASLIGALRDMFDQHGTNMLTPWEQQFVTDLIDRGIRHPSEKQEAVIQRIVAKYRQWEGLSNFGFYSVRR
jgi:hypothetical protein